MKLRFYNTLTKEKEVFIPLKKNHAGVYSCGPTVYWYQHIGNLRSYIFSDVLRRTLEYNKYKVKQIVNVTDVGHLTSDADTGEDKLEKAAKKEKKTAKQISNYYLKIFQQDLEKLDILPPHHWPKATEHIKEQQSMINTLEKNGYTYETSDGIYFNTSKLKDYGKLAHLDKKRIKDLEAGKRVSLKDKKNITDFALWKFSQKEDKRQQEWSFKGRTGFPGWHIECSAMSMKYLGEHFDIHTGGEDHVQIHHTNEIAQSEAATGKRFVNYWLHGAFLTFKGEKVSKSKGGLYTLAELQEQGFDPMDYRYLCLTSHYRTPLAFSLEAMRSAKSAFTRLKEKFFDVKGGKKESKKNNEVANQYKSDFLSHINDDLNMPRALALTLKMLKDLTLRDHEKFSLLKDFNKVLGFKFKKKETNIANNLEKLIQEREKARKKKDFRKADEIRKQLEEKGIVLEDTKEGVKWKLK